MKTHDLVRVKNQQGKINDAIAVVTELNTPTIATVAQLELTGYATVVAMLPIEDLEIINDTAPPQWRAAYAVWKGLQIEAAPAVLSLDQAEKITALIANKYGIEYETLRFILSDLQELGVI